MGASLGYVVLSRKYRPKKLDDLIGQDVLTKSIKSAIEQGKMPHAFLFCGIRGVGKTTIARILARCLNCDNGPTSNPCGVCKSCVAMDQDQHLDVLEFDAASRTGVDDIRSVIDSCQYAPVNGKYKIFIIDEVHMLSKSAFNALLKTLEEPPEHVKFVFATTEKNKVPETILSRCVTFQLNQIPDSIIADRVKYICKSESQEIGSEAANLIASEAQGSARDAISLLEQTIMYCGGEKITKAAIVHVLGSSTESDIRNLLQLALLGKDYDALRFCHHLIESSADPYMVFKGLQNSLYKMIVEKTLDKKHEEFSKNTLLYAWQILLNQSQYFNGLVNAYQVLSCSIVIIAKTSQFSGDSQINTEDYTDSDEDYKLNTKQQDLAQKISEIVGEKIKTPHVKKSEIDILGEIKKSFGAVNMSEIDRTLLPKNIDSSDDKDESHDDDSYGSINIANKGYQQQGDEYIASQEEQDQDED